MELDNSTTVEAFWSNVEREMRRGVSRTDAIRTASRVLHEACDAAGVEAPDLSRHDAVDLLPKDPGGDLLMDDASFNRLGRLPKRFRK